MENTRPQFDRRRIAEFCRRHGIVRLALYGSILREDFAPTSDVDVLVEFEPESKVGLAFFTLQDELTELIGWKVDLNTPGFLGRHIRNRVLAEAQDLYVTA